MIYLGARNGYYFEEIDEEINHKEESLSYAENFNRCK